MFSTKVKTVVSKGSDSIERKWIYNPSASKCNWWKWYLNQLGMWTGKWLGKQSSGFQNLPICFHWCAKWSSTISITLNLDVHQDDAGISILCVKTEICAQQTYSCTLSETLKYEDSATFNGCMADLVGKNLSWFNCALSVYFSCKINVCTTLKEIEADGLSFSRSLMKNVLTLALMWLPLGSSKAFISRASALASLTHRRPSSTAESNAIWSSGSGFRQKWLNTFTSSRKLGTVCKMRWHKESSI